MTNPTAAERAAAIFPASDVTTFRSVESILRDIEQAIADAEAAARADEREACAVIADAYASQAEVSRDSRPDHAKNFNDAEVGRLVSLNIAAAIRARTPAPAKGDE